MSEAEAKTKWCPFARALGTLTRPRDGVEAVIADGAQNRGYQMGGALPNCLCLGSGCMAWRWSEKPGRHQKFSESSYDDDRLHEAGYAPDGESGTSNRKSYSKTVQGTGYCGLAGTP